MQCFSFYLRNKFLYFAVRLFSDELTLEYDFKNVPIDCKKKKKEIKKKKKQNKTNPKEFPFG